MMKIETDRYGRRLYKFSSSVAQGGYLYAHKINAQQTNEGSKILNKEGLRNLLTAIVQKHELIDATIKVYDTIFFLFFMSKPSLRPVDLINAIQEHLNLFGVWNESYVWTGVYDLQEKFVRPYLQKAGYNYEKG